MYHSVSKNTTQRLQTLHRTLQGRGVKSHVTPTTRFRVGAEVRSLSDVLADYGTEVQAGWSPDDCLADDLAMGRILVEA